MQDAIGTIGNAHLAQSDRLGLFAEVSQKIAYKNAIAVDFPKTGKAARPLNRKCALFLFICVGKFGTYCSERAFIRPDFMGSILKREYLSRRLAGRIHRQSYLVEQMLDSAWVGHASACLLGVTRRAGCYRQVRGSG